MWRVVAITVALVHVVLSGCSQAPRLGDRSGPMSANLLFDAQPGWPVASDMAFRSTWPSTLSYGAQSEQLYYREHFIDLQRTGPWTHHNQDYVYRRFTTYRVGQAAR